MKKFAIFLLLPILVQNVLSQSPEVTLPKGQIRGRQATTLKGVNFNVFEGIPFAKPPVGELRFQTPQENDAWDGVLETTSYKSICYQAEYNSALETEDCLYLNVYTPQLDPINNDTKLPVLFFIYGGGFVTGDCTRCGPDFHVNEGVILVTPNYRVGPFGFLSTGDLAIPGNAGLKDQHFAIKWTKENIALFGGDPEKITISGLSAGAASASYQLLNENSVGLFRGVIQQSGTFLCPWAFQRKHREIAFETASYIDESFKTNNNTGDLKEFLMNVPASDLDAAAETYHQHDNPSETQMYQGFFWAPVVEEEHPDAFITQNMYEKLKAGDIVKVPILLGITSEEYLSIAGNMDSFADRLAQYDEHLEYIVPYDMRITDSEEMKNMAIKIRDLYTGGETLSNSIAGAIKLLSDNSFNRAVIKQATMQAAYNDVYLYQFSYFGPMTPRAEIDIEGTGKAQHGDDDYYLFHHAWDNYDNANASLYPAQDVLTQARIQKAFLDFVKYLNPTPEISDLMLNISWPKVNSGSERDVLYVDINNDLQVKNHPRGDILSKWDELYSSLGYDDFDTY